MTSLGRYVIVGQYSGKYGKAYRLAGLDVSNSNAISRSIVFHKSPYAGLTRIGRSEGCPARFTQSITGTKALPTEWYASMDIQEITNVMIRECHYRVGEATIRLFHSFHALVRCIQDF